MTENSYHEYCGGFFDSNVDRLAERESGSGLDARDGRLHSGTVLHPYRMDSLMMVANRRGAAKHPSISPPNPAAQTGPIDCNPLGVFSLAVLAVYLLLRIGVGHDYIAGRFGFNLPYHYVCVPILVFVSLMGGRIFSALGSSVGAWLSAYTFWMAACVPTSVWKGGSFVVLKDYILNDLMIFVVVCGVAVSIVEQTRVMYAMAACMTLFVVIVARSGNYNFNGRYSMDFGTFGNPNSIASHLLFLAPFVMFLLMERPLFRIGSMAALFALLAGPVFFFRTGSRGGLLALIGMIAVGFVRLSRPRKTLASLILLLAIPVTFTLTPKSALVRYMTLFSSSSNLDMEEMDSTLRDSAEASSVARTGLLMDSIRTTIKNPVFGVGPGQFMVFAADEAKAIGKRASWHVSHNSYTQVSSEMGLVGLVFYLGVLLTTVRDLRRVRNSVAGIPHLRSLQRMASCLFAACVGYCVFSAFDSVAYMQYLPLLAAMSFCLKLSAERELAYVTDALRLRKTRRSCHDMTRSHRPSGCPDATDSASGLET